MKRKIGIVVLALVLVAVFVGLVACEKQDNTQYTITVKDVENGKVTANAKVALAGTVITLTVSPSKGYKVSTVKMNGTELTVTDGKATFKMPSANAEIIAEFILEEQPAPGQHKITLAAVNGGEATLSKAVAVKDEVVTIDAKASFGYVLQSVKVDGTELVAKDGVYSFVMPDNDVAVEVNFVLASDTYTDAVPEQVTARVSSRALAGAVATADFVLTYTENGVKFTAYVVDEKITDIDGVSLYFGTTDLADGTISSKNHGAELLVGGEKNFYNVTESEYVKADSALENASVVAWVKDGEVVGYKADAEIPYSLLGTTKQNAEGKLTVLPVLSNNDRTLAKVTAYEHGSIENADTYYVLSNGQLTENYYLYGKGTLGQGDTEIATGTNWDLSQDYSENDINYANRKAVLNGNDNKDNNVVMWRKKGANLFATATFKVTGMGNPQERYGKFGLMLFDQYTTNGVFFYVDAYIGGDEGNKTIDQIQGTSLGYNVGTTTSWGSWNGISNTSGSFNLSTKTITLGLATGNDGIVYMYLGNRLVATSAFRTTENTVVGFKSFGYNIEVTDYSVIDDTDEDFANHIKPYTKQDLEVLFLGDSYMDFWKNLGGTDGMGWRMQTAAIKGNKENIGIGGTQIPFWTSNTFYVSKLYNVEKFVFHIGVNDIDDGDTTGQIAYERLLTMLEAYHTLFPDAEIYWVSLIHNNFMPQKCGEYDKMNASVKAFAENTDYLTYIDVTSVGTDSEGNTRADMFYDTLHLNKEWGYPQWSSIIMNAIGYPTGVGNDILGDYDSTHVANGNWTYNEDGTVRNTAEGAQVLWFKGMSASANFYITANITSPNKTLSTDVWTKVGMFAANDNYKVFGYIDVPDNTEAANRKTALLVYSTVSNKCDPGWLWNKQGTAGLADSLVEQTTVKMTIAKVNDTFYLFVNDKLVSSLVLDGTEEQTFLGGIMGFHRDMTVSHVSAKTGTADEIAVSLGVKPSDNVVLDGVANDGIWTEEVLGNTLDFGSRSDGGHYTVAAVKGTSGVFFYANIWHKSPIGTVIQDDGSAWWNYLNIEFRMGKDDTTQHAVWFNNGKAYGLGGVLTGDFVTVTDGDLNKTSVEFYVPYIYFDGFTSQSDEIRVYALGWVSDGGWNDVRKEATVSTHGLRYRHNVSVGEVTGATVTVDKKTACKGDIVNIDIELKDGYTIKNVFVNGEAVAAVDGQYSFVMPDADAQVTVEFKGRLTIDLNDVEGKITATNTNPLEGEEVEFTVSDNWKLVKLYVDGKELSADKDGKYKYTLEQSDIVVTGEFNRFVDGKFVIDGTLDEDAYGEMQHFYVEGNRDVSFYAVATDSGVVMYLVAHTDTNVDTQTEKWYENHNIEFYIANDGVQRYLNNRNDSVGVTEFRRSTVLLSEGKYAGKYEHRYELFISADELGANFNVNGMQVNYAYKAPGEAARYEGMGNDTWDRSDWWTPVVGACDANKVYAFGVPAGRPANLSITKDGLKSLQVVAKNAKIDADFSEYSDKLSLTRGNDNAKVTVTGFVADDGYYFAFTILQKTRAAATAEWHLNDNLEIPLFGTPIGFSIFDDFICAHGAVTSYAMKRTEIDEDGYKFKTEIEMFVAEKNQTVGLFRMGCNGNGFGGWQSLVWDGADRVKISANGCEFVNGNYKTHALDVDNVNLDGKLDDAFWTGVTKWNNKNCTSYSVKGVYAEVQAKKGNAGVYLAVTMYHDTAYDQSLKGDGTAWYQYLNIEYRFVVNGNWDASLQRAACPWNNGMANCEFGWTSESNTESIEGKTYKYKTVFEIFTPYEWALTDSFAIHADMPLYVACVAESDWDWVLNFGADATLPNTLTDEGFVRK